MVQDYEKLFSQIQPLEPPVGLFERIVNRIQIEQKLITVKRRIFLFSAGLFITILAFIPTIKMAWSGLTESGFLNFFSLIFSDAGIVASYWQNFALSLLETLPVTGLVLFLVVTLVFLEMLKLLTKNLKLIFNSKQLIH